VSVLSHSFSLTYLLTPFALSRSLSLSLVHLLRQLLRDPNVTFAGYKVPHPLDPRIIVKLQTLDQTDPHTVCNNALNALLKEFSTFEEKFRDQLQRYTARHDRLQL
jgi:DNA-directed RNA polymerase subunit L